MNINLIQLLTAIAVVGILFACLLPAFLKHDSKQSRKSARRYRVRPLNRMERCALPFVLAMDGLSLWWNRNFTWHGGNRLALGNTLAVTDGCRATRVADAALARRSFVKVGSDGYHVAACTDADIPLGHTGESSTGAAEETVSYGVLGLVNHSIESIASGAVADGEYLVVNSATTVKKLPVAQGTYYIVGRYSGPAVADGKAISFIPCFPTQRVVA